LAKVAGLTFAFLSGVGRLLHLTENLKGSMMKVWAEEAGNRSIDAIMSNIVALSDN
jgi:hypothetical protein